MPKLLRDFMLNPLRMQEVTGDDRVLPEEVAAVNLAAGAAKKKAYGPQKVDSQVFSKALWVGC